MYTYMLKIIVLSVSKRFEKVLIFYVVIGKLKNSVKSSHQLFHTKFMAFQAQESIK